MLKVWFAIPFWQRVLGAFVAGMLIGGLAPDVGIALKPLGDLFIKAIKMLVAPLIFCAIVSAITELNDCKKIGRLGVKTIGLFMFTAVVASAIGLTLATVIDITRNCFDPNRAERKDHSECVRSSLILCLTIHLLR